MEGRVHGREGAWEGGRMPRREGTWAGGYKGGREHGREGAWEGGRMPRREGAWKGRCLTEWDLAGSLHGRTGVREANQTLPPPLPPWKIVWAGPWIYCIQILQCP